MKVRFKVGDPVFMITGRRIITATKVEQMNIHLDINDVFCIVPLGDAIEVCRQEELFRTYKQAERKVINAMVTHGEINEEETEKDNRSTGEQ